MGARDSTYFTLTPKGVEELAVRTHRLDARLRNILFLIQKGTPTVEAILQNSIFPEQEVIEKLRGLLKERFVELDTGARPRTIDTAADPITVGAASFARTAPPDFPTLDSDISMTQARFVLCDFCLDYFGIKATVMVDAIEAAANVAQLQQVLDRVTAEVRKHFRDQLPVLMAKVREINQTGL